MNSVEPKRPERKPAVLTDEEREILFERLKTFEADKKSVRPSDEVFRRILQNQKP